VVNVTHHALAQTMKTVDDTIDPDTFYVVYNHSVSYNMYDGEREMIVESIRIDEILCAFYEDDHGVLVQMIRAEAAMINRILAERLTALYPNGGSSDSVQVSISTQDPNADPIVITQAEIEKWIIIGGSVLAIFLLISLCVHCVSQIKLRREFAQYLQIKNGLIVCIAIGKYDSPPPNPEIKLKFENLPVEADMKNLKKLAKFLNFEFLNVPKSFGRLHWSKAKILQFLREDVAEACFDDDGQPNYDGIIVSVSGHGVRDCIVSSEYERIDRTEIHRSISDQYAQIRKIPRIFLFDACNGDRNKEVISVKVDDVEKGGGTMQHIVSVDKSDRVDGDNTAGGAPNTKIQSPMPLEMNKNGLNDGKQIEIGGDELYETEWNPDFNLVVVHGSNDGFISKMQSGSDVGSYLTYLFVEEVMERIERGRMEGMDDLLRGIQRLLHDQGKQLIEFTCFNDTNNLRIERHRQ